MGRFLVPKIVRAPPGIGGKVITFDSCFGELGVAVILETPGYTMVTSLPVSLGASGTVRNMWINVWILAAEGFAAA